jgi:hypothetical protein
VSLEATYKQHQNCCRVWRRFNLKRELNTDLGFRKIWGDGLRGGVRTLCGELSTDLSLCLAGHQRLSLSQEIGQKYAVVLCREEKTYAREQLLSGSIYSSFVRCHSPSPDQYTKLSVIRLSFEKSLGKPLVIDVLVVAETEQIFAPEHAVVHQQYSQSS